MNAQSNYSLIPQAFYTGLRQPHQMPQHSHGFCHSCCHPISKCCCGSRECRKVAKELLANSLEGKVDKNQITVINMLAGSLNLLFSSQTETGQKMETSIKGVEANFAAMRKTEQLDMAGAIIGGGCCVHISIEYMPSQPQAGASSGVMALVQDSEGTMLTWGKTNISSGYHIKEGIITTNPGAQLKLIVLNAIARLRWCEVFSC